MNSEQDDRWTTKTSPLQNFEVRSLDTAQKAILCFTQLIPCSAHTRRRSVSMRSDTVVARCAKCKLQRTICTDRSKVQFRNAKLVWRLVRTAVWQCTSIKMFLILRLICPYRWIYWAINASLFCYYSCHLDCIRQLLLQWLWIRANHMWLLQKSLLNLKSKPLFVLIFF